MRDARPEPLLLRFGGCRGTSGPDCRFPLDLGTRHSACGLENKCPLLLARPFRLQTQRPAGKAPFSRTCLKRTNTASRGPGGPKPQGWGARVSSPHPPTPPRLERGSSRPLGEMRGQGCSRFIWFSFRPKEGASRGGAGPRSSTRLSKDRPGLCSLGWLVGLASCLAGESVVKELSRIFWKLLVSASECESPPPFSIVSSEIDGKMLWEKKNWEREQGSIMKELHHCDFRSCRTPHTRLTRLLSQKGVARAGVRASAARV